MWGSAGERASGDREVVVKIGIVFLIGTGVFAEGLFGFIRYVGGQIYYWSRLRVHVKGG